MSTREKTPRRVVIVGGVAGGMSCAARARRLDEQTQIVVLERGAHVSFANCGLPYYVGGEITDPAALLVQTPESLRAALALDVRVHHDVTAVDPEARKVTVDTPAGTVEIAYDALVLAPGAQAARPPIPGLDSPRVRTLRTVDDALALRECVETGARRAVVLGAGFIGIEAAEALAHAGLQVLSVGVRPDTAVFEASGVACERGAMRIDARGRTNLPGVWAVGDATVSVDAVTGLRRPVALAGPANRAGRLVADDIVRPDAARPVPAAVGTAIVRVGSLTVALTGANRAALDAAGVAYRTIHLHSHQHAGYFPGATQIHLVVHFGASDGRILGAQAVGADGVDRRIDVLATGIRAGMHVEDLIDLDLAYSPPYGQAKDAVNLAGMVGENVRNGTLELWYAEEIDSVMQDALVLDTRSRAEFATGHLPGALNIPHTELRERLDEVRVAADGRRVRVMCASGVRSAIAYRVLAQEGFDAASLSGGILTLRAWLGDRAADLLERESVLA